MPSAPPETMATLPLNRAIFFPVAPSRAFRSSGGSAGSVRGVLAAHPNGREGLRRRIGRGTVWYARSVPDSRPQFGDEVLERTHQETKEPPLFKVVLINDDYTTMEFVVEVLVRFFRKTPTEATQIMLQVHTSGVGICGVYTYEVAEMKVAQVSEYALENGYPLRCTMEPE